MSSSSFRLRSARLAVAGAAGLASVVAVFPVAHADDTQPPTTEEPTTTEPIVEEPPAPTGEEPPAPPAEQVVPVVPDAGTGEAPTDAADDADAADDTDDAAVEEVEPNFGFQKFRVGVKLADGATVPDGVTTAGTEITITVSSPDDQDPETYTCETDASTLDTDEDETATYCLAEDANFPDLSRSSAARSGVEVDPDRIFDEQDDDPAELFVLLPGQTAVIEQTSSIEGVERPTDKVTIEPCEADELEGVPTIICANSEESFFQLTNVLFVNDDRGNGVKDDGADAGVDDGNALLPDTGGSDLRLLGLGALLVGGGAALTTHGLRRPRRADALADRA